MRTWCAGAVALLAALALLTDVCPAQEFSLATWNAEQASVEQATRREASLGKLGDALRKEAGGKLPDVVVLQEITSYAAAARIARSLGYRGKDRRGKRCGQ